MLVTDAMMAAGAGPGPYTIGDLSVVCDVSGRVAAPGSATLAGSSLTMSAAVGLTCRWAALDVGVAWAMASTQPARYLGLEPRGEASITWSEDFSAVQQVRFSPESLQ